MEESNESDIKDNERKIIQIIDEIVISEDLDFFPIRRSYLNTSYHANTPIEVDRVNFLFQLPSSDVRKKLYGNMFNMLPIKFIIDDVDNNLYSGMNMNKERLQHQYHNINTIFTITDKSYPLAIINLDANIIIDSSVSHYLYKKVGEIQFKEIITKILKYTKKLRDIYGFTPNVLNFEYIQKNMILNILGEIHKNIKEHYYSYAEDHSEKIVRRLIRMINSQIKQVLSKDKCLLFHMTNENQMYRLILEHSSEMKKIMEKKLFQDGITVGSKFLVALQQSGYVFDKSIWRKDVNIIPELCIYEHIIYKLPENHKYKVKTLKFDISNLMKSKFEFSSEYSFHPNISKATNNVCVGTELSGQFFEIFGSDRFDINDYVNILKDVETVLKIVNFDSSYWSPTLDFGSDFRKKFIIEKNSGTIHEKIKGKTMISTSNKRPRRIL